MDNYLIELLNSMTSGASVIDANGDILFTNAAYANALGETRHWMTTSNMNSDVYDKKLSVNVFREVIRDKKEVRRSQIYLNECHHAFRVRVFEKPVFEEDEITHVLAFAESIEPLGMAEDLEQLKTYSSESGVIAENPAMQELIRQIQAIAAYPVNVLLIGETGSGKDKMAELLHDYSDRKNAPFVVVNCAALAENLIESELFGYAEKAFTGASGKGKKGLIEEADGGILYLDEINSLPLQLQGKLLRALETRKIRRVGSTKEYDVDFRLISASNANLKEMIKNGEFREDLYYRINVVTLKIPPLRERKEDIIPLFEMFVRYFNRHYHINAVLSKEICSVIRDYAWPGNVRELRNFAERYVISGMSVIGEASIIAAQKKEVVPTFELSTDSGAGFGKTLKSQLLEYERAIIASALQRNTTKGKAAKELGIDPAVLSRKIAKFDIDK